MSGRMRGVRKGFVKAGRRTGAKRKRATKVRKKSTRSQGESSHSVLMEKVEACLDSFRYEEAAELCLRAVEREPDSALVLEEAGPLLLELGHVDHALKCLRRAAELRPEEGHVKFLYLGQLASGEEAVGSLSTAISIMTREREGALQGGEKGEGVSGEDISRAYCSLAEVFLTDSCFISGAEERCHECCREAVRYAPSNPEAHQLLSSCLLSMSRTQEAKEAILMSLSLWLPRESKEAGEGEGEGEEVREVPPYFFRVSSAKILMELQMYDDAHQVLERLLRDDDGVVLVWYLMGWLHVLTEDRDSAHFYLEQANELVGRAECDDEQMVAHISELLAELGQQTSQEGREGEREGEEEEGREGEEVTGQEGDSSRDAMDVS